MSRARAASPAAASPAAASLAAAYPAAATLTAASPATLRAAALLAAALIASLFLARAALADQGAPTGPINPTVIAPGGQPTNPGNANPKATPIVVPTVSTAAGAAGGIVVLWPRVIPADAADRLDPVAIDAQARLSGLVAATLPGRPIELRPKPERSCPQGGCNGLSVGVLIANVQEGCAAVALIGQPGQTPRRLIPWAGRIERKAMSVPFRDPPESQITVTEFVPCAQLGAALEKGKDAVAEAIRFGVGNP